MAASKDGNNQPNRHQSWGVKCCETEAEFTPQSLSAIGVELGRFVQTPRLLFIEGDDLSHALDIFPKIPFVQGLSQNDFVQPLELSKGELLWQQFKDDVPVGHILAQLLQSSVNDRIVVKGQCGNIGQEAPFCLARKAAGLRAVIGQSHQAVVTHRVQPGDQDSGASW